MPDVKHFDSRKVMKSIANLFWRHGGSSVGMEQVVEAAGINRSSLYSTFGKKHDLYIATLREYVESRSIPEFTRLSEDETGMPAVTGFFRRLIYARFLGEEANWGCMVSNAHSQEDCRDSRVRDVLDDHHDRLKAAMQSALQKAQALGQLQAGVDAKATAEMLTLTAYGINLRSRAGADGKLLQSEIATALKGICSDSYLHHRLDSKKEGENDPIYDL